MVNPGGEPFRYDPKKTPYSDKIMDALDHPAVRMVLVQGNTRSGKTVAVETFALKRWEYGPATNVIWFVQDEDSLNDYIDERGDEMLRIHEGVNEKIDWGNRTVSRKRKNIGRSKLFYRPATQRSMRMKSAPLIVGDEIDAWTPKVRDAAPTLITSRQEEFGTAAKAFLTSHPDAGPDGGIAKHLKTSLLHLWWVNCPHCKEAMSPAQEAEETGRRLNWNVDSLMHLAHEEGADRQSFLKMVEREARLVCPNEKCNATFDKKQRIKLMAGGEWLQPHQRLLPDGSVAGEAQVQKTMGFIIHAFMAPFVKLDETAVDYAAAKLDFLDTGNDHALREVIVKKLGEIYRGAKDDEIIEGHKVVQARLASRYRLKTVPAGVKFLTAFVDIQGDRFEVRVIGWDLGKQSWLIDAFSIKEWPRTAGRGAFEDVDPANRLSDWDLIDEVVLPLQYPLADNDDRVSHGKEPLYLPIARTMVDSVGVPGVTDNARAWMAALLQRKEGGEKPVIQPYRVVLVHGYTPSGQNAKDNTDIYGKLTPIETDDRGKQLEVPVTVRRPNVYQIKRIIARRMKVAEPGPGRMHLPNNISAKFAQELVAERLMNGKWEKVSKNNETWDGWVMCEVARSTLKPDRRELWTGDRPPEWAEPRPYGQGIDTMPTHRVNPFDRLAEINRGVSGEMTR